MDSVDDPLRLSSGRHPVMQKTKRTPPRRAT